MCPLKGLEDLRTLRNKFPHLWENLRDMDKEINEHCVFNRENQKKKVNFKFNVSFTDIEQRFEVEDEFLEQGKKIGTKEFFQTLKDRNINY